MIAPLKQTDYARVKQLFQDIFDMSEESYFMKAWSKRNLVASVGVWHHDTLLAVAIVTSRFEGVYRLEYVFTHPSRKGEGIGSRLLQHVLDQCPNIHLTSVEDPRIHAWYIKKGFRQTSNYIFTRHSHNLREHPVT